MAAEDVKNTTRSGDDYDSKTNPVVSSGTESSTSLSVTGQNKDVDCSFDTTEAARFYKPVPTYEGYHRWDPDLEWDEQEEKKIVRKVNCPVKSFSISLTDSSTP